MVIGVRRVIVLIERRHLPSVGQWGFQDELGEGEIPLCVYRLTTQMSTSASSRALSNRMGSVAPRG